MITGATGLVGGELLKSLRAARPDWRFVALSRSSPDLPHDIRQPLPPLDVQEIVHCAADTRFDRTIDEARSINYHGTLNVLEFARRCPRLERMLHVSTAFVCGRLEGDIPESPLCHSAGYVNTYQESKSEAEEAVISAMEDIPLSIARISSIAGDNRPGNYVHQLVKLAPRAPIPMMPCLPDAPVDLVDKDWVIGGLATLLRDFEPGRVHHLCAGPALSLTVSQVLEETRRFYEPRPIVYPRAVSIGEYREFAAKALVQGSPLLKEVVRVLGYFLPHLGMCQRFCVAKTHPKVGVPANPRSVFLRLAPPIQYSR